MRILVACEESQAVSKELRRLGHEAYSCDIQECSGGAPEWHIQGDALIMLDTPVRFTTMDGKHHIVVEWDMVIAFPPCTYLSAVTARLLHTKGGGIKDEFRYQKGLAAASFFKAFLDCDCDKVAIENPRILKIWGIRKPDQVIEPYMFGHPYRKRTCLWLKGLPKIRATKQVKPMGLWCGSSCRRRNKQEYNLKSNRDPKIRSKTFPGIARAMAEQWAGDNREPAYVEQDLF